MAKSQQANRSTYRSALTGAPAPLEEAVNSIPEAAIDLYGMQKLVHVAMDWRFAQAMRNAINNHSEGDGGLNDVLTPQQELADRKEDRMLSSPNFHWVGSLV